jgi:hypothetical protein
LPLTGIEPVHIGYTTAREYFDYVASASYSRFLKHSNLENAIEAAKAIWDLRDWLWRQTHPGIDARQGEKQFDTFTERLMAECPDLDTTTHSPRS